MKKKILLLLLIIAALIFTACPPPLPYPGKTFAYPVAVAPTVVSLAPTDVNMTSSIVGGKITENGDGPVIASGICWSLTPDPSINNNKVASNYLGDGFTISLKGLKPNTTYYYRAYATNGSGIGYGEEYIIVTSSGTVTDIDGNVYQTVKIGTQEWMRENLRTTRYSDGNAITGMSDMMLDDDLGHHYSFDATTRSASKNLMVLEEIQGVCPTGWHVPSEREWAVLAAYTGVPLEETQVFGFLGSDQGDMFKEAGNDHWSMAGGNNCTGFTALPGGICNGCELSCLGTEASFWTSSSNIHYGFKCDSRKIIKREAYTANFGLSVRCIKNITEAR